MSPLFSLLLGHIIGDFVLQTIDLVRYKSNSWKGLLLHSAIVTAACAACLWSHLPQWWPWLIPLFGLHWLTDWGKVYFSQHISGWKTRFFFLDQLLHILAILVLVILQAGRWPYPSVAAAIGGGPSNRLLAWLMAWLIAFFVVPIMEAQAAYALARFTPGQPNNGNGIAATMPDRFWGGAERTLALLLLYAGSPAVWFAPLAFVPRIVSLRSKWKQPEAARFYRVKIATGILCTLLLAAGLYFIMPHL